MEVPYLQGVLNSTICDKVCQWLAAGSWFSPPIEMTAMIYIPVLSFETG
jgi:hypothetical protein